MEELGVEGTPIEIGPFNQLCSFFSDQSDTGEQARGILYEITQRTDSWLYMHPIIEETDNTTTRLLALKIFGQGIGKYWNVLEQDQKDHYRDFYFEYAVNMPDQDPPPDLQRTVNSVLIEILKNEWPFNWISFTNTLLTESKRSEKICRNNLCILAELSDAIHSTRDKNLTSERLNELDAALDNDFRLIFSHLESILADTESDELRAQALTTLAHYLNWIDLRYIITSPLCQQMVTDLLPLDQYRVPVLECFTAIANHQNASADANISQIFDLLVQNLDPLLSSQEAIAEFCDYKEQTNHLVLALTSFLLLDGCGLLNASSTPTTILALYWMANLILYTEDNTFEICIDMWHTLSKQFMIDHHKFSPPNEIVFPLITMLCTRMTRPAAFCMKMNEGGEIVSCEQEDSIDTTFYSTMGETLHFMCRSPSGTTDIFEFILEHISEPFTLPDSLPFFYSIGSIAGAFTSQGDVEKEFFTQVLSVLDQMLDPAFDSSEAIFVAGCFCFVASSYKHVLQNDWNLLKDVLERIVVIVSQQIPPLQILAMNCLKEIAKRCHKQMNSFHGRDPPITIQWIGQLGEFCSTLPRECIPDIFEMVANLTEHYNKGSKKDEMVQTLFGIPLQELDNQMSTITSDALADSEYATGITVPVDALSRIISVSDENLEGSIVEEVIGRCFTLLDGLTEEIKSRDDIFVLRRTKKSVIKLFEAYICRFPRTDATGQIVAKLFEDFSGLEPRLQQGSTVDAITALIETLKADSEPFVEDILNVILLPTREVLMDNSNSDCFTSFPDIRLPFFRLLSSLTLKVFPTAERFGFETIRQLMEALMFGLAHPEQAVSDTAMNNLRNLLAMTEQCREEEIGFRQAFFNEFYQPIVFTLLEVMTDNLHEFSFDDCVKHLFHMVHIVQTGLYDLDGCEDPAGFLAEMIGGKMLELFPSLEEDYVRNFAESLINAHGHQQQFRDLFADFLISLRKASPREKDRLREDRERTEELLKSALGLTDAEGDDEMYYDAENRLSEF